ncbi:MAG: 30S ribosomal protein S6 [Clostridia bacterium]|nr:30S ribosomal protein S6 [Clostridia bacterium]MDE6356094.1 30S ribosomal protein S6 [Clostridia bacterium]MDE7214536.1 30S ribosomal protein S6 [Clostridia bacterium]
MKTYEMIYILDAAAADEAKEAVAKKFGDVITSAGGNVLSVDKWGVKKLAYPINYKTEGDYVLMTFDAEGTVIKELDRVAGLASEVLRRVITVKQ